MRFRRLDVVAGAYACVAMLTVLPAAAATQQEMACENKGAAFSPETQISGCTALIRSGRFTGRTTIIADFNQAIRLKPDLDPRSVYGDTPALASL